MSTNTSFSTVKAADLRVPATVNLTQSDHLKYFFQQIKTSLPLLVADVIAFVFCIYLGYCLTSALGASSGVESPQLFVGVVGGLIALFTAMGLYSGMGMHPIFEFRQCLLGICLAFAFIAAALFHAGNGLAILLTFPLLLAVVPLTRATARHLLSRQQWWGVKCLVFSCDRRVNRLFAKHLENIPNGLRPIGFVQDNLYDNIDPAHQPFFLSSEKDAGVLMKKKAAYVAIVHRRGRNDSAIAKFVEKRLKGFSRVIIVPDDERLPSLWSMGQNSGILIENKLLQPSSQLIKRIVDIAVSATALVVGMPFLLLLAAWVKITSPGPLFFGHQRIGRNGKLFKAWKFRSMCVDGDEILKKTLAENADLRAEWEATQKLKDDPRVSSSGRFLRKTSLDEIPQLWNVLRGEMSLVGPRPIVVSEVEKYDTAFENYLRVTPGVTGFWQISGRNLTSYDKRVELDDYYVKNWSVWFDLYILGRTIKTVLMREGAF